MKDLLKVKGIIKENKQLTNILRSKTCPNCRKPNKPDAQFSYKCSFVMDFTIYQKNIERNRKDQEISELKEQVEEIRDLYQGLIKTLNEAVDLREKVRANPQEFLEAGPFKFAAIQKRRYNAEAHA